MSIDVDDAAGSVPRLVLRAVHKAYTRGRERIEPLRGVDLEVATGEVVALTGRSGTGKSTIVHVAGGLSTPDAGSVRIDGEELAGMSARKRAELRRRRVGFVFQFFHLLPTLNVEENVAFPLVLDGVRGGVARERARQLLASVDLDDRGRHRPSELSGGEMQRVAIARALVHQPVVLFADEPTGSLDATTGDLVMAVLTRACREEGAALLLVTHDPLQAHRADRILELVDGKIL